MSNRRADRLHEGWGKKRSVGSHGRRIGFDTGFKNWKRRYIVLGRANIDWFNEPDDDKPKGRLTIGPNSKVELPKPCQVRYLSPQGSELLFAVDRESTAAEWLRKIRLAIQGTSPRQAAFNGHTPQQRPESCWSDEGSYRGSEVGFEPSRAFAGARRGYVFRNGREGVGYYLDPHARETDLSDDDWSDSELSHRASATKPSPTASWCAWLSWCPNILAGCRPSGSGSASHSLGCGSASGAAPGGHVGSPRRNELV